MEKKLARILNSFLLKCGLYLQKSSNINTNNVLDSETQELWNFKRRNAWICDFGIKTVFDIGANEGQFAKKIDLLLPNAKKICFEPLKDPFEKIKKEFAENKNFSLFQVALGNSEEEKNIFRNEYSPSSSILKMRQEHKDAFAFARKEYEEKIKVDKLDNLVRKIDIDKPYLIKIDVQGFESEVIKGGIDTVSNAEMIILETSFTQLYENAPLFGDIYNQLYELGFVYSGSIEQLTRSFDGKILQQDSIFIKNK